MILEDNPNLVVAGGSVHDPSVNATEVNSNGFVALRYGISHDFRNGVESHIADTEPPDEVVNVSDVLLMGLGGEEAFQTPRVVKDLVNQTESE